jgi:hypothetical protein
MKKKFLHAPSLLFTDLYRLLCTVRYCSQAPRPPLHNWHDLIFNAQPIL